MNQTAALLTAGIVLLACLAFGLSLRTVRRAGAAALAAALLMPVALYHAGPDEAGSPIAAAIYLLPLSGIVCGAVIKLAYLVAKGTPKLRP